MAEPSAVRVVSLVPSATETLVALGAEVVACTRFCEQPELSHVGGTKNPDLDAIRRLEPDVVVMDQQENRREDADALRADGLDLLVTDVCDVAGAIDVVGELAALTGRPAPSLDVMEPRADDAGPRVFVPIWRRPWMALGADTYGAAVLAHLGVGLADVGVAGPYPEVDLATVAAGRPDTVLVPSEPYDFRDEHLDELRSVAPRVSRVDGQDLFWWGIRTPDALVRLGRALGSA